MGGSKTAAANAWSNLVVLCSDLNGQIEADDRWARVAKEYGWKLESWQDPLKVPIFDFQVSAWFLLDDHLGRNVVDQERNHNANS